MDNGSHPYKTGDRVVARYDLVALPDGDQPGRVHALQGDVLEVQPMPNHLDGHFWDLIVCGPDKRDTFGVKFDEVKPQEQNQKL